MKNRTKILITAETDLDLQNYSNDAFEFISQPFIRITPEADAHARVRELASQHADVIFTSKHSVQIAADQLSETERQQLQWRFFGINGSTSQTIRKLFPNAEIAATAQDAKELASAIINNNENKAKVFFCGNLRRPELPRMLQSEGVQVRELMIYQTIPSPIHIDVAPEAIIFMSPSAVESFFSLNTISSGTICFSVGETTTAALLTYTSKIVTSTLPSLPELIRLAKEFFTNTIERNEPVKE